MAHQAIGRSGVLVLLVLLSAVWALSGCGVDIAGGAQSSGPAAGDWLGADLKFHVQDSQVTAVELVTTLTCSGENGCQGSVKGPIQGQFPLTVQPWKGQTSGGPITIHASFSSATAAMGTLQAQAGSCCVAVAAWSANWLPGTSPGQPPAAVVGWGKASTGTLHPAAPRAQQKPAVPPAASPDQLLAAQGLEKLRAALGLPAASQHPALSQAAQLHAEFYVNHGAAYAKAKLSPHAQDSSFGSDFTGKDFGDRAAAAGYGGQATGEVMAFSGSAPAALQGWLDTVYHRFPLIHPRTKEYGYGQAAKGNYQTEVMDIAESGAEAVPLVVYPYPGQSHVPLSWNGLEGPQPPPPPTGYPSGPVITARFAQQVEVTAHSLRDAQGKELPHVWLDAKTDSNVALFDNKVKVLYAHQPLTAGMHTVRLEVKSGGAGQVVEWSFSAGQ